MRNFARRAGLVSPLLILASFGCGPEPVPVVPAATVTAAAPTPPPSAPAVDLSPVAEPEGLVGLARWKNPAATATALGGCASVPQALVDQGKTLAVEEALKEALRGGVDPKAFAGVIATDAPVDMAVAFDPTSKKGRPLVAFSFGLTSLDAAKSAAQAVAPVVEKSPGVFKLDTRQVACVIAQSSGSTPARLICGEREKDVAALEAYLARTAPTTEPATSDLHAEVRFQPLEQKFDRDLKSGLAMLPTLAASQASLGEPRFDGAVQKAATALADELGALAGDLDKMTFDFGVDPTKCINTSLALKFRASKSWLVGTMTDRADRAGAPPAIFWRAPKDSDSVIFGRAADPARYTEMLATFRAMIEGGLGKLGVGSAADRKALADLFTVVTSKDATSVTAKGRVELPKPAKASKQADVDSVLNNALGWYLIGVDQPSAPLAKQLKDFVAVANRKGLIDPIKKELGPEGSKLIPSIKTVAAPAPLGKDAIDVEVKVANVPANALSKLSGRKGEAKAKDAGEKITVTLHVLLMADGNNTWIGFGANRDAVVKHMLISKSGAPDTDTIATLPGLDTLKSAKNISGGYMTLAPIISSVVHSPALQDKGQASEEVARIAAGMPNKGLSPIFLQSHGAGGASPFFDLELDVSKETLQDISYLVQAALTMRAGSATTTGPVSVPPVAPPPGKRPNKK